MKILPSAGLLVLGLGIGLVIGRTAFAPAGGASGGTGSESVTRMTKRDRGPRAGSGDTGMEAIRRASPDAVAGLTALAMSEADPIERHRRVSECLLRMDAGNWQAVMASFDTISKGTGRDNGEAWKLGLVRSGQVAGEAAMNEILADGFNKNETRCWSTLYGWGMKDPRSALDWLQKAAADGHKVATVNYTSLLAGAALSNPSQALRLLDDLPAEVRNGCAGHLVWNVVQNSGTEALDDVLKYASELDTSNPINARFATSLADQAADKLLWQADHARDVPKACEAVVKLTRYGQDPTRMTARALQKYQWYGMPDKLSLLNGVSASSQVSGLDLPALASQVLGTMNGEGDRAAVRAWLDQNPDSPLVPVLGPAVP